MGRLCYPTQASGQSPGSPRQRGWYVVTVQGGYGVVFAILVQSFIEAGRVVEQFWTKPLSSQCIELLMRAHAQCRGTKLIGARKLSRYIGLKLWALARVRVQVAAGFVLGAVFCKNHDKQLTHIVRVIASVILRLSGCDKSLRHVLQDFLFASSFRSFGSSFSQCGF